MDEPLERAAELAQLADILRRAPTGNGQVCLIEGPSGIGKSHLLKACADQAAAAQIHVARVLCSELTRDYPFGVVLNLFGPLVLRADSTSRARALRGPASLAEPVFGNGAASDEIAVLHGLYWLTVNLAEQGPLAILVDDLPWADPPSQRFFAYLAERIDDLPIALVATIRSGDQGVTSPWVTSLWNSATSPVIRPAALSSHATEVLLVSNLPAGTVDEQLVDGVMRHTGGNPFYVVAIADAMRAGESPTVSTPEQVRRHITLRLTRLGESDVAFAKALAVIGNETSLREVAQTAGLADCEGVTAAERLVAGHFLQSAEPAVFTHDIVREAIYDSIEADDRLVLHARAAQVMAAASAEPEVVAEHLLLSSMAEGPWAQAALHAAGRAATRKCAHAAARRYLRHAVDATDAEQVPPSLLIDVGLAEAASGEVTSLQRFEKALTMVTEPDEQSDALFSLGATLYRFGRYSEALNTFRRGTEFFATKDHQIRLRFESAVWSAKAHLSPTETMPEDVANLADRSGAREIWAVKALYESLTRPPVAYAAELAERALDGGALLSTHGSQCVAVHLATLALLQCNRLVEANDAADAVVRHAVVHGLELEYAEASWMRALVLYARGRVDDAAADAQAAFERLQPRGNVHAHAAMAVLVHCMIDRGELDDAAQLVCGADLDQIETPIVKVHFWIARGRLHLSRGETNRAHYDVDRVRTVLQDDADLNPTLLPWRTLAAIVAHRSGDEEASRRYFHEEIELARSFEVPIALGTALRCRAGTEPAARALPSYREAVECLEGTGALLELAHAHVGVGRCLARRSDMASARRHLVIALDLAHRCGATALMTDIQHEVIAAGGRPRRAAQSGKESLTPTETRVAKLAAQGISSRDIAEQLFVSRNTVTWHLRHVYRKLDVESREQLVARWDAAG
jgi:DNA-binding CsgD family transcriptional regulator/tetratricopeptide (TPR) repeat protein